jgi:hypothetical protein
MGPPSRAGSCSRRRHDRVRTQLPTHGGEGRRDRARLRTDRAHIQGGLAAHTPGPSACETYRGLTLQSAMRRRGGMIEWTLDTGCRLTAPLLTITLLRLPCVATGPVAGWSYLRASRCCRQGRRHLPLGIHRADFGETANGRRCAFSLPCCSARLGLSVQEGPKPAASTPAPRAAHPADGRTSPVQSVLSQRGRPASALPSWPLDQRAWRGWRGCKHLRCREPRAPSARIAGRCGMPASSTHV